MTRMGMIIRMGGSDNDGSSGKAMNSKRLLFLCSVWICLISSFCDGLQIHPYCDEHHPNHQHGGSSSGRISRSTAAFLSILKKRPILNNKHYNRNVILQRGSSSSRHRHSLQQPPTQPLIPLLLSKTKEVILYTPRSSYTNKNGGHSIITSLAAMSVRNGAMSEDNNENEDDMVIRQRNKAVRKYATIGLSVISLLYVIWSQEAVRSFDFRGWLIQKLDYANDLGSKGLIYYSMAFALWEIVVGVTTPVETAAGMAFGVKRGIIANACGKLGGALLAFLLGRFVLKEKVSQMLEGNEMMSLVQESIQSNPIGVALIWRFSFLPEFVKNFGLAILPLKTIHFLIAIILHGFPFTCLWTFIGAEADMLVRGVVTQPSKILKLMVSGVYVFGFIISPTLVGLWVKSLKDRRKKKNIIS